MKPLKALIIEDSKDDAALLLRHLSAEYEIDATILETPSEMKDALDAQKWDIILSDYTMPHFSGIEALAILKASGLDIPFIIISGTIGEDVAVEAMLEGVSDYLMKDNLKRLAPAIERELENAAMRQERLRAETSLRRSEENLAGAQRIAHIGSWETNLVNNRLFWSDEVYRIFGVSKDQFGDTLESFVEFIHPEDRRMVQSAMDAALEQAAPYNIEHRIIRPDGVERIVCEIGEVTFDESGKPVRFTGSVQDVTDRRRMENELAANRALLVNFVKHTPAAVAMLDTEMRYLEVSDQWLTDYNLADQDIIGKSHYEIFPDAPERWKEIHRRCLAGAVEKCDEDSFPRADGTLDWLQWETRPWHKSDGEIGGILFFTQVITRRKQAEKNLEESVKRERALIENSLDVICSIDAEGRFASVSPASLKVWGYHPEELVGLRYIDLVAPEDVDKTNQAGLEIMSGVEARNFENRYRHKNGSPVDVMWTAFWSEKDSLMFCVAHDITERRRSREDLENSRAYLEQIINVVADPIFVKNRKHQWTLINDAMSQFVGRSSEELIGKTDYDFFPANEADVIWEKDELVFTSKEENINEGQFINAEGEKRVIVTRKRLHTDKHGEEFIVAVIRDITADRQIEEALKIGETKQRQLAERQSAILNALPAHICLIDQKGDILEVNEEWKKFAFANGYTGINAGIGSNYIEVCENVNGEFAEGAKQAADMCRAVLSGKSLPSEMEYPCHSPSEERWFKLTVTPLHKEKSAGAVVMHINITERKRIENQLLHDAFHDELTGLANRMLFMEHLRMAIARGQRHSPALFAVLFLDFDRFKLINDSLGHAQGDKFLKLAARQLETVLRAGDLVARLGGDEFVIFLSEINDESDAVRVAERIQEDLKTPFEIGGREIYVSASIGISISSGGDASPEDMVRDADIAMYRAKSKGKAQYQIFDQAMHEHASKQLQLETEMRQALKNEDFLLNYQPIINLETNSLVGFEALVRWRHRTRGMIPPLEFIGAAEDNNLILPLGRWVLQESCRQLYLWQKNPAAANLTVSVNLSSKQFLQPDLAEQVAAILDLTGLDPHCLKLEITESHIMENSETAITIMNRLRALGVELSLDDFGTGYSSLSYLHRLPVSYLKIDRSFVSQMIESEENSEIVNTIIKLARNLKMKVIAEGIETGDQLALLRRLNCEFGQGYFFAKPIAAEAVLTFIDKPDAQLFFENQNTSEMLQKLNI